MSVERYVALLADLSKSGVYRVPETGLADLRAAAKECGFAHLRVRLDGVRDKEGFLNAVAQALGFPHWFGHNWDALEDCLTDLSWHEAAGFLVTLSHAGVFCEAAPQECATALRIFDAAADAWREEGVAFWTLVDIAAPALPDLPDLR